jgi:excisionase family DNA binding protein
MITTERLLTINDLTKEFGVTRQTIHSKIRKGELKSVKLFGKRKFRVSDILSFYASKNIKMDIKL